MTHTTACTWEAKRTGETRLVSCSGDHTVRVWEAPEAGLLRGLPRK